MKGCLILFVVALFFTLNTAAQKFSMFPLDPGTPFDPYFVETRDTFSLKGPHTITRNILQDKKGNYWFSTWQGIMRYDGKTFTNITLKEGLIHFHVNSMFEDKTGTIWFGTVRGGLYKYNGSSYTLYTTKDGLPENDITCMTEDKAGNIWFGSDKGVSFYDGKHFRYVEALNGIPVNCMLTDSKGKLWIGAKEGVYVSDGSSFTLLKQESEALNTTWSLAEDEAGNIWIGGTEGLWRFDGRTITHLRSNAVPYILKDKDGTIWLSLSETNPDSKWAIRKYYQSLYRYDGNSFTKVVEKNQNDDCQVFGIMQDKKGYIWFGTMKGPCRYDPVKQEVGSFTE